MKQILIPNLQSPRVIVVVVVFVDVVVVVPTPYIYLLLRQRKPINVRLGFCFVEEVVQQLGGFFFGRRRGGGGNFLGGAAAAPFPAFCGSIYKFFLYIEDYLVGERGYTTMCT